MRKFVIASILALTAGLASAEGNFGGLQYNYRDGYSADKGVDQSGYTLMLGTSVAKNTDVDLQTVFRRTDGTGNISNRLEAGLTQKYDIADKLSAYVRGAVGEKWNEGTNFSYYSIEPGVKYAVTPALGVRVAYRYRDSFADNKDYQTNTLRLATEYAVSKSGSVMLGYDRFYKDQQYNGLNLGYNFKF